MGWHLGGYYTPAWIDRLVFPDNWSSLDTLDPRLVRALERGDKIPDGPPGTAEFVVARAEAPHLLVLRSTTHVPPVWDAYGAAINWTWCHPRRRRHDTRPSSRPRPHVAVVVRRPLRRHGDPGRLHHGHWHAPRAQGTCRVKSATHSVRANVPRRPSPRSHMPPPPVPTASRQRSAGGMRPGLGDRSGLWSWVWVAMVSAGGGVGWTGSGV